MSIPSKVDRPAPPYSSGTCAFIRPVSCAFAITSTGCCNLLVELALERPDLFRRELARERAHSFCSSVRAKETPVATFHRFASILRSSGSVD
jgi:hypothetical protein